MTIDSTYAGSPTVAETDEPSASSGPDSVTTPAPRRQPRWKHALLVFGAPLVGISAFVAILVAYYQPKFLINDDASLSALVSGTYTGNRTSSLVIAPAMLGHVERVFYVVLPHLPWYGIFLYVMQITAWAIVITIVFTLRRRPPVAERLLVAAVLLAFVPWMTLRPSYTPTSILIGTVGILVFAVGARVPGRRGLLYALGAGLLLGSAFLIRSSSFLAVVVAFAPVLALIAYKSGIRRSAVFAVAVGMLMLVGVGTNYLQNAQSAEWRAFTKMNKARGMLHDTPRLAAKNVTNKDLAKIGWTRNDLWLFSDFIYPASDVFTDHDIQQLAKLSPLVRRQYTTRQIAKVLQHKSSDSPSDKGPILASLVIVAGLLVLRWNRWSIGAILVSAVWLVAVVVVLMVYVRLPSRVYVPLQASAVLLAAIVPAYLSGKTPRLSVHFPRSAVIVAVVVALFVAGPAWHGIRGISTISHDNTTSMTAKRAMIAQLTAFDPQGVYTARGDLFGQGADPLSTTSAFNNPKLIPLGWTQNSPLFADRLARDGINDLTTALRTQPHVYFLGVPVEAARLSKFYAEHRGIEVKLRPIGPHFSGGLFVWSATAVPAH